MLMEKNMFNQLKIKKHVEIVNKLLDEGFAYKCYCTEHRN